MQQFEIVGMQLSGANITIEHKTIGGTLQVDNKELERARREGPGLKLSPHYVNELPVSGPWSSLVEGDIQLDRPSSKKHGTMSCMCSILF